MPLVAGDVCVLAQDFIGETQGELSVFAGESVTVLESEKPDNAGWILVNSQTQSGYVPVAYLDVATNGHTYIPKQTPQPTPNNPFDTNDILPTSTWTPEVQTLPATGLDSGGFGSAAVPTALGGGVTDMLSGYIGNKENWKWRDNDTGMEYFPTIPLRRWYYKDLFNDKQGPFNADEMKQRIQANHVKANTPILIETGFDAAMSFHQDVLSNLFSSPAIAFTQPPVIDGTTNLWYYVDSDRYEQGPFSTDQMKLWFDQGYFYSTTSARLANGIEARKPLFALFSDPVFAFSDGTTPPPVSKPPIDMTSAGHAPFQKRPSGKELLKSALSQDERSVKLKVKAKSEDRRVERLPKGAVVYGEGWGTFKGIPNARKASSTKEYSSLLYTFVTRPLHPAADTIRCYIQREVDGAHLSYNKYTLFLESSNTPILMASRHYHTLSNYYEIKLLNGKDPKGVRIATLEASIGGTEFLLHNNVPGHSGAAKDLTCVLYERSRGLSSNAAGPRKMRAGVPRLKERGQEAVEIKHKGKKKPTIAKALSALDASVVLALINKPPKWNAKRKAYTLEFKGRAKVSSVKNFQLVDALKDPQHENVLMTHGKVSESRFNLDTKHPLALIQTFAIALSSLHSKKLVE